MHLQLPDDANLCIHQLFAVVACVNRHHQSSESTTHNRIRACMLS